MPKVKALGPAAPTGVEAARKALSSPAMLSEMANRRATDVRLNRSAPFRLKTPGVKMAASILAPSLAGPKPCIEGWGNEASEALRRRLDGLKQKLEPGDIISTDPRRPVGVHRAFKALSKTVQGTRFGHSAMYIGNGQIVESRDTAVIKRPLLDLARCNEFVVHRPKGLMAKERAAAASWMKQQVGKDGIRTTVGHLLYRGARPTVLAGKHEGERQELDRIICSSLIANAYAKTPFNKKRGVLNQRPNDIQNSEHVKRIGVLR